MILHGSKGHGPDGVTAVILAAHGFLAFPFGYSNGGNAWNAGDIINVSLDRTVDALAALRAFPFVGRKVGIYGTSRGAEHALLLASLMARDVVDAFRMLLPLIARLMSSAGRSTGGPDETLSDPGWQSWNRGNRVWSWRGSSDDLLPTTPIEIERFAGPLFLSHSTADRIWSFDMTRRLTDRLNEHGRTPEVHFYEGQDHIPGSAAENDHHEHLIAFFERSLAI